LLESNNGGAKGCFRFDLNDLFRGPSGRVDLPKDLHVTAIRGSHIGAPTRLIHP
jgi:hypothetical protein